MNQLLLKKWHYIVFVIILLFSVGCNVSNLDVDENLNEIQSDLESNKDLNEIQSDPELEPPKFESESAYHTIEIHDSGFSPNQLNVNSGDTVKWKNKRSGSLKKALIQGTRNCINIKGPLLQQDEEFEWTFINKGSCQILEAITKTQFMTVTIK